MLGTGVETLSAGADYFQIQLIWSTGHEGTTITLSTTALHFLLTRRNYTYLPGTSMACPIVSGGVGTYFGQKTIFGKETGAISKLTERSKRQPKAREHINGGWEPTNGYGFFDFDALMRDQDSREAIVGAIEGVVYERWKRCAADPRKAQHWDPNTGLNSGFTYQVSCDSYGVYRFAAEIPPGIYDVWAQPGGSHYPKGYVY